MKHSYTICPHCGCGCGLYIVEQDGAVSGATASQGHGLGQGQLCARGWTCHQLAGSASRLKTPMLGEPGKLSPASWEETVDRAAEMLKAARDKHGAESIGVIGSSRLTIEEAWVLRSLAEDVLKTPHLDSGARLGWVPLGLPNPGRYQDIDEADLIMAVGVDLLEENPILGARVMSRTKPAEDRPYVSPDISHQIPTEPAKLVWVNSRPSDLAAAAAVRIQTKPGREWVFLAALLQKLAPGEACRAKGLDQLKESLARSQLEKLLAGSGAAAKDASRAAAMLAAAARPLLIVGKGLWQQEQAGLARAAVIDLALMTDRMKVMQTALGANDAGCGAIVRSDGGLSYMEMIEAAGSGKLKALVLAGEDPLRALPGSELTAKDLAALEILVVIDSFSSNKAIPLARAVLPMALPMEKAGSFRNIEGADQKFAAAVQAPSGVRGLDDIVSRWAKTLGGKTKEGGQAKLPETRELLPLALPEPAGKDPGYILELGTAYPHLQDGELFTEGTPHLSREFAGGWAEMHPDDIAELGLRAGWRARFVTESGKLEALIRPNPGLLRKTIFMPLHFGANALAPFRYHPEMKAPVFRGIETTVEKI